MVDSQYIIDEAPQLSATGMAFSRPPLAATPSGLPHFSYDPIAEAARFQYRFLANRSPDDPMYVEAARSVIQMRCMHFEPAQELEIILAEVFREGGTCPQEDARGALQRELIQWIAPKLATLLGNAETTTSKNCGGFQSRFGKFPEGGTRDVRGAN